MSIRRSSLLACRLARRAPAPPAARPFSATAAAREKLLDASAAAFASHISNAKDRVVIVDFYDDWCPPCKVLSPLLERIEAEPALLGVPELDLVTLRCGAVPDLAAQYEIQAIPTVFAFKNGAVVGKFVGAKGLSSIQEWFSALSA